MSAAPPPESQPEAHRARDVAESFGTDADRYDRARPRYPDALIERIVAASPGPDVLDVGIGTGIVARQLRAAGCTVLGVDVDARMAEHARRLGFDVEVATFEEWDSADRTFDAVVAGQTWHWIEPVAGAAKAAQVLRPGGRLAVFWNVFLASGDVARAFSGVYSRLSDLPFNPWARPALESYSVIFAKAAEGMASAGPFGEPERWRVDWERTYTRDEWLDQVPSFGGHTQLSPDRLTELLAAIGAAVDQMGGSFTMRYAAVAVTARLEP